MEQALRGKKVLIAEDEVPMLQSLAEIFREEGCEVAEAQDGEVAVELALAQKPDLIVLDILMPKMTGMEVLKRIRESDLGWGKKVPIIVLTNLSANEKITRNVAKHEPSYYLVKTDWKLYEIVDKAKACLKKPGEE